MQLNHWWSERFQFLDSTIVALESGIDAWAVARELARGAAESLRSHTDPNVTATAFTHFVDAARASDARDLERFKVAVYGARAEFSA